MRTKLNETMYHNVWLRADAVVTRGETGTDPDNSLRFNAIDITETLVLV